MRDNDHSLGFESFAGEETAVDITIQGKIPAWLRGTFLRNGPAKYEIGNERLRHWFDGYALLSKIVFHNQGVRYHSKFLASEAYKWAKKTNKVQLVEFATKPKLPFHKQLLTLFYPRVTDNDSVNTTKIGNDIVALTESYRQNKVDLNTLECLGEMKYQDNFTCHITTAHPHYDFKQRETINFALKLAKTSQYCFVKIPDQTSARQVICSLPVKNPGYVHTFSITENYGILIECPLVLNPIKLFLSAFSFGKPFIENYCWAPEQGSRFIVIDRRTGEVAREFLLDAFFMFHTVNAYERGQEIIVDVCAYEDPDIIGVLYLESARKKAFSKLGQFKRFILSLQTGKAYGESLAEGAFDFPRINYKTVNSQSYQYIYCADCSQLPTGFFDKLVKINLQGGSVATWREEGCYTGEPVFIATPTAKSEDDGVVMSIILDAKRDKSFLLILDAISFQEIARADLPHRLPFGLHGQFYSQ